MTRLIRVGIVNDTRNAHHMGCWLVMRNLFRLLSQHDAGGMVLADRARLA